MKTKDLPCQGCKGLCCGPVPVTAQELKAIKKKVKSMSLPERSALKNQSRLLGTCIFYDTKQDQCGIHAARPEICRMFGYFKGMACYRNPDAATKEIGIMRERPIGMLSIDFTWSDFT